MNIIQSDNTKDVQIGRWESYTTNTEQCLHESCERCNGTGVDKTTKTPCVHMISCPCPKCTPRFSGL